MSLLMKKILQKIKDLDAKLKTNVTTEVEIATNKWIDGKQIYYKRVDFGALANAGNSAKSVLPQEYKIVKVEGIAVSQIEASHYFAIPNSKIQIRVENGWINITTETDMSAYNAYVDLYYTKN